MTWSSDPAVWVGAPARAEPVASWPTPDLARPAPGRPPVVLDDASPVDLAYERGYLDGADRARTEMQDELLTTLQALGGATQSLQAVQAALAGEMEDSLCTLSLAIAQRIVQRELTIDPAIILDMVRDAVGVLPPEPTLEIRLHPDDLAALDGQLAMAAAGGRPIDVQWIADADLERGGYVIESPQRVVDGRLDHALAKILQRLRDV